MLIGIIGAMARETDAVMARMHETETREICGIRFCRGMLDGVPAVAAFFPIGGAALIFSSVPPALCWACMALSLVAATAGQEILKRTESEKKDHHGRRNQKR